MNPVFGQALKLALCLCVAGLYGCGGGDSGDDGGGPSVAHVYASLMVDVNGDAHPDLLRGDSGSATEFLFINDGAGHFPAVGVRQLPAHYLGGSGDAIDLESIDAEGDGDTDILAIVVDGRHESFYLSSQVHLFINDGAGNFSDASAHLPASGMLADWPEYVRVADFDNDGHPDLLLTGSNPYSFSGTFWRNDGQGTFAATPVVVTDTEGVPLESTRLGSVWDLYVADVDGDPEALVDVVDIWNGSTFRNHSTPGALKFTLSWWMAGAGQTPCRSESQGALVDYNGDGLLDLVATTIGGFGSPEPVVVCRNTGGGNFIDDTTSALAGAAVGSFHPRQVIAADFDNDGNKDVYIADHGYDADTFPGAPNILLRNNGNGTFTDASAGLSGKSTYTHGASVADVNGDGLVDLFENNSWTGIAAEPDFMLFMNQGGMVFAGVD